MFWVDRVKVRSFEHKTCGTDSVFYHILVDNITKLLPCYKTLRVVSYSKNLYLRLKNQKTSKNLVLFFVQVHKTDYNGQHKINLYFSLKIRIMLSVACMTRYFSFPNIFFQKYVFNTVKPVLRVLEVTSGTKKKWSFKTGDLLQEVQFA
jgi:hypothetical protein